MKNYLLVVVLLCPVTILNLKQCELLEINEGHLYHEEKESLKKASKTLQDVLGVNPAIIYSNCFQTEQEESESNL